MFLGIFHDTADVPDYYINYLQKFENVISSWEGNCMITVTHRVKGRVDLISSLQLLNGEQNRFDLVSSLLTTRQQNFHLQILKK